MTDAAQNPVEFVQRLLDLRDKHTSIIDRSFSADKQFHRTLREVCPLADDADAACCPTNKRMSYCHVLLAVLLS